MVPLTPHVCSLSVLCDGREKIGLEERGQKYNLISSLEYRVTEVSVGNPCGMGFSSPQGHHTHFSQLPRISTMPLISKRRVLATLDADIQVLYRAKDVCDIPPAQAAFDSSGELLTAIRVRTLISCEDEL